jgi:membrane-associated two-gene conflict system component 1 (EACC1)
VSVSIKLVEGHPDALRTLRGHLLELNSVKRADLENRPVLPGELGGGALELLTVVLGAGGAGTVLIAQVLGWLRSATNLKVRVRAGGQEWDLCAEGVRRLSPEETADLIAAFARAVEKSSKGGVEDD